MDMKVVDSIPESGRNKYDLAIIEASKLEKGAVEVTPTAKTLSAVVTSIKKRALKLGLTGIQAKSTGGKVYIYTV